MVFSSLLFLIYFFPVFFLLYWLAPQRAKNILALLGSVVFYSWGAPRYIFILIGSSYIDYFISYRISEKDTADSKRKWWLYAGVCCNLCALLYFKYAGFFVEQVDRFLHFLGLDVRIELLQVSLPLGISFFTFQKISYLVDVYRQTTSPSRTFTNYLLYVMLFPQLIAGPIIRYHDIAKQLDFRSLESDRVVSGIWRFCIGLARKVLLANPLGEVADLAFNGQSLSTALAWLGMLAYGLQIYHDFAGYSDMAIGLGRMMGFEYLENFNFPYVSRNFTEFWKRWHISLTNWMREYLYIPLGGNRKGRIRTVCNLWVVFLLSGFWHGASWNFVLWGAYHGFFLSLDKICRYFKIKPLPVIISVPLTFFLVLAGWVLFRAETLHQALVYYRALAGDGGSHCIDFYIVDYHVITVVIVSLLFSFVPLFICENKIEIIEKFSDCSARYVYNCVKFILLIVLYIISMSAVVGSGFNPFIYFKF